MNSTATPTRIRCNELTLAQVAARVGADVDVVRHTLRRIGMPMTGRTCPASVIEPLRKALQISQPDRLCVGKYNCIKCGAFCGLVWDDGGMPDGPDCDEPGCPAVADLGPPTFGSV